ncbi:MAG: apolipoprotein N-acyltransferase [Blastocatellia bacterium]|jgi:apolipoprotein N-acyltransferase|nr:apolipoprotein N-acyltransferase [Blastocatellia bacterium]
MHDAVGLEATHRKSLLVAALRASIPTSAEVSLVTASALLLILSFPDFELWPLAWVGLVPFLMVAGQPLQIGRAFLLGWLWGLIFFYGTCWWLTYPMIHYAHISAWLAYPLLLLPIAVVAVFPALFSLLLSRLVTRFGLTAAFAAPLLWVASEWIRYAVTGQLWNALGYSQAFHPLLIQSARWGSVYAVSFLIVSANAALAYALLRPKAKGLALSLALLLLTLLVIGAAGFEGRRAGETRPADHPPIVVAVQPNVPMESADDSRAMEQLLARHLELSGEGLRDVPHDVSSTSLVIWPESPMNFSYSRDPHLRDVIANFARSNHTFVLLNSLEPAADGGEYNSAVMVNEEGRIVAQYDKIRLMPFGEYVPLPHWLPGASSVRGIVGDFTPGSSYTLMPLGAFRAGVFICIEAAHPSIARSFANESADVLINISNDGYLGPTPVMRQHLSNAVLRAVENARPLIRVTNNGITAYVESSGRVSDATGVFAPTVRTWQVTARKDSTFYTQHGDLFAYACALISLGLASASFRIRKMSEASLSINRRG